MSVIFGTYEADKITVVADKREYNMLTNQYNDNSKKLFQINEQLCIAIAGSDAMSKVVNIEINNFKQQNNGNITTDDISNIITLLYRNIILKSPSLLKHPFCCIYAGIDKKGEPSLVCGTRCSEGYIFNTVSEIIFNPADMEKKDYNGILIKNYIFTRGDYPKNILCEIAEKSKYVSACGDKWIFDIQKRQGTMTQI